MSSTENSVAIMQPYIFPYIGYFQLINAVSYFVFYDDVNYIKQGWINRNSILNNNNSSSKLFSVPIKGVSSNRLIKDTKCDLSKQWIRKFFISIEQTYSKTPYFNNVYPLIEKTILSHPSTISELAISSVLSVCEHLNIDTQFFISSQLNLEKDNQKDFSDRLIKITKHLNCDQYINLSGGKKLYSRDYFSSRDIQINFIETHQITYKQYQNTFIPNLSIIDILMFNSPEEVKSLLMQFEVV